MQRVEQNQQQQHCILHHTKLFFHQKSSIRSKGLELKTEYGTHHMQMRPQRHLWHYQHMKERNLHNYGSRRLALSSYTKRLRGFVITNPHAQREIIVWECAKRQLSRFVIMASGQTSLGPADSPRSQSSVSRDHSSTVIMGTMVEIMEKYNKRSIPLSIWRDKDSVIRCFGPKTISRCRRTKMKWGSRGVHDAIIACFVEMRWTISTMSIFTNTLALVDGGYATVRFPFHCFYSWIPIIRFSFGSRENTPEQNLLAASRFFGCGNS